MKANMTPAEFLSEVASFVGEYQAKFGSEVPLNIVNRRFGLRCKAIVGCTIRELLDRNKSLFRFELLRSGASAIALSKRSPLEAMVIDALGSEVKSFNEIASSLRGSGFKVMDLMETITHLQDIGLIKIDDGAYSLTTADISSTSL